MSGESKTLPLTEFIEMLARRGDGLYLTKDEHGWTVGLIDKADATLMGHAAEWEDIATDILGVRVVARDEASELRAALERIADWPDGGNLYGQANIKRFAADTLRRLAGGEAS